MVALKSYELVESHSVIIVLPLVIVPNVIVATGVDDHVELVDSFLYIFSSPSSFAPLILE